MEASGNTISLFENKWIWFLGTLVGGFLPVFGRLIVGLSIPIELFDIKDVLFAGVAMNLSNFTLVGYKEVQNKVLIIFASALFTFFMSFLIAIYLCSGENTPKHYIILNFLSCSFCAASIFLSWVSNKKVAETS